MNIEIITTKKKLTKSIIKQFELADWKYINFFFKAKPEAYFNKIYRINDVYKYPVVIFQGHCGMWYQFPMHKYTLTVKGDDCYVNNARHLFINSAEMANEFIDKTSMIKDLSIKVII